MAGKDIEVGGRGGGVISGSTTAHNDCVLLREQHLSSPDTADNTCLSIAGKSDLQLIWCAEIMLFVFLLIYLLCLLHYSHCNASILCVRVWILFLLILSFEEEIGHSY